MPTKPVFIAERLHTKYPINIVNCNDLIQGEYQERRGSANVYGTNRSDL